VAFYSIEIGGSQTIGIKIEDLIGMQFKCKNILHCRLITYHHLSVILKIIRIKVNITFIDVTIYDQ